MRPRRSAAPYLVPLAPLVFAGAALGPTISVAGPPPPPGTIVWDSSDTSPDRTTRTLRFLVDPPVPAPAVPGMDAIKVTMVDLQNPVPPNAPCCPPPAFGTFESATCTAAGEANGCARWVGKPGTFYEFQGPPQSGAFRAARLQCAPFYTDWVLETHPGGSPSVITVVGAEIVPSSTYSVQAYGAACMGSEAGCLDVSPAVEMLTRRSGDVWPGYNPPLTSRQPDALDVVVEVSKFKACVGAPIKAIAQVQPNLLELNADVAAIDLATVVDAFKGLAYPFSGPCPCPSAVTCGPAAGSVACATPTVCTSSFGAGAMCVKTCVAGDNAGDPCITNTHCPGSTCGEADATPGYCRDRCGRCGP